jgi:hypothetical protein
MASNSFKVKNSLVLTPKDLTTLVSPEAGDLACDINDNNKIKRYDSNVSDWVEVGSGAGGGGLDVFHTDSFDESNDTSGFSKGNDAAFLGGGSFQGVLALEQVNPISGTKSLKYTQQAGSLNDYFASELIDLDPKQRDNTNGMSFYFEYDGADNDGRFVVYDVTNSQEIASEVNFVKLANKSTRYSLSFYVPASCTQIQWGYQVLVENIGAELVMDDVEMSTNPFVSAEIPKSLETQGDRIPTSTAPSASDLDSLADISFKFGSGIYSLGTGVITILKDCVIDVVYRGPLNQTQYSISILVDGSVRSINFGRSGTSGVWSMTTSLSTRLKAGSTITFAHTAAALPSLVTIAATGVSIPSTSHILTPSDTFSTDTAPLTYANAATYTLSTLANAPIGTYITFTYAANTNTRTQTTGTNRPTQTDADMNQNGMRIFTRAYNAASTAASPAAFAIQIGKGLKGNQIELYKSIGKVTSGSIDCWQKDASQLGIALKTYDEKTGVLLIDAGFNVVVGAAVSSSTLSFSDTSLQTNGYLTINASRSLPLLAVPVPLTAYLKDVKPSGTAGGTFTSGAWQTRTLNTVEGDGSIVSLSGSQFQLGPGKYEIEASAPGYAVTRHQIKLFNISTSSDVTLGNLGRSADISSQTLSLLFTNATLSSTTVFEIQHRCETTRLTDGFGNASIIGSDTAFTQVKITKVG